MLFGFKLLRFGCELLLEFNINPLLLLLEFVLVFVLAFKFKGSTVGFFEYLSINLHLNP